MMERIRTAANSMGVKVILGIIILSFIFAGVGGIFSGLGQGSSQFIAKVNGIGINRMTFENAASAAIRQNKLNENQTNEIAALRQDVLRRQIEGQLLHQLAERLSISPTNEQIKTYIRHEPYFMENGQFNNERYLAILAANRLTPDDYAESVRGLMRQQQLLQMVVYSDFILPVETEVGPLVGQKRTILTATLTPEALGITQRTFDENALHTYYNVHPQQFTVPTDRVKLRFIRLARHDLEKSIVVSDAQLNAYYDQHKKDYLEPAKMAYSVIETEDKATANTLHAQLIQGADFSELAAKKSLYPMQRQTKGMLGWFEPDDLPDTLKKAQLDKVGAFSAPLKQEDGHYLLVRFDKKQDASVPSLNQIEKQVRTDLIQDLADKQLQQSESTIQSLVDQGMSLTDIAQYLHMPLTVSTWLTQEDKPLSYSALAEQIMPQFGSKDEPTVVGPVYVDETQDLYVAEVAGFRAAGLLGFDTVKADVQKVMQNQDQHRRFAEATQRFINELQNRNAAALEKVHFSAPRTIVRMESNVNPEIVDMVYRLIPSPTAKPVFGVTYLPNGNAFIVSLVNVENQKPEQDIDAPLFYQGVMDTQESLADALISTADITLLTDQKK